MKKSTIIKIGVSVLVIAAVGVGGYFAYNYYTSQQRRAAMMENFANAPETELVERTDVKSVISGSGTVYLKDEPSVYSTTEAKVAEVYVEVGDKVMIGQALVRYDTEDKRKNLEKQIAKAEVELSSQQLSLKSMTLPATSDTVKSLETSVDNAEKSLYDSNVSLTNTLAKIDQQKQTIEKAKADLEDAEKSLKDSAELLSVGGISQSDYDKAVSDRDSAADKVKDAETSLDELIRQKESNEMNVKTNDKSLQNAEEKLAEASVVLKDENDRIKYQQQQNTIAISQMNLEDLRDQLAEIVETSDSTLTGTVTNLYVQRGKQVDKESELMTLADFNQLIAKADISEYDAPALVLGQAVTMTSDGLEGITYTGKVIKIGDSAKTQSAISGTETVVPIEVSIDNVDGKIKPGFNLDLDILVASKENALSISAGAAMKDTETGEYYVFAVDERRMLVKTPVTLGTMGDMTVEVLSGLEEGANIVSSPTEDMQDGMPLMAIGGGLPNGEGFRGNFGGGMGGGNAVRMGGGMGGPPQ